MAYLLLAVTLISSTIVFRWWLKILIARITRLRTSEDLAEVSLPDWPGLVGAFLPRKLRIAWNIIFVGGCFLVLGLPHLLVVGGAFRTTRELRPWDYFHYSWTLIYWLALLAYPAVILARHRVASANR